MCRVHRDRRKQQVEFLFGIFFNEGAGTRIQFVDPQNADAILRKRGAQLVVPTAILVIHKLVRLAGDHIALFHQGQTIRPRFGVAIFNLLHQSSHAHFEELIQVAGRDGKKFQPLEQRVGFILRFFEHAAVESQPGGFPVDVVGRIV